MTDLTIDGEIFRVEVEGDPDRPAVLLSCSLGTDLSLFDAQMPALLEHFRVVRYDPRGHGASTASNAPYSLDRLGADALAILDALGIDEAHVVGISMGGAVAQWLLVNAPDRISRAVLANTAARIGTPEVWNARIRTVLAEGTGALAAATMERWFGAAFREAEPERVAAVEATFRATSAQGYAGCCAALRDADLHEAIRAIDSPVLILTGRDDPVTSEASIAVLTEAIPGARHVVLECRHISNIEAEAAFNAAVIGFLTAKAPARTRAPRKAAAPARRPHGRAAAARGPLKARATGASRAKGAAAPAAKAARKAGPARRPAAATRAAPVRAAPLKAATKTARKSKAPAATKSPASTKSPTKSPAKAATKARAATKATPKKTRGVAGAGIAKTSAARKPVAKQVTSKKAAPKKAAVKKAAAKTTTRKATAVKKPAARRPSKGRPSGRRR